MQKTSIKSFPYIRTFSCLAIILLHTLFASNVYFEDVMSDSALVFSKLFENLVMWAVPCFLMITGCLLLNPEREVTQEKIRKYLKRMIVPLLAFTFIFECIDVYFGLKENIFTGWIYRLFTGQSWAHMWYLYLMIGLYLMIPFYRMITANASDRTVWRLIGIIMLFVSLLPLSEVFGISTGFYIPTSIIYPAYLFMGYEIYKNPIEKNRAALLFAGCTAAIAALTFYEYNAAGITYENFDHLFEYSSPLVLGQAAGLFCLMNSIDFRENNIIAALDDCGFGIYIIHMIFIRLSMKHYGFNPYENGGALAFAGMVLAFYLISFVITYAVRKASSKRLL